MSQKQMLDSLYEENLDLGNKINVLTDENNFYRIQINNFNKLTNSINKDLYKLGLNFQKNQKVGDIVKVGPLFVISNKIKLKNLQMKVGNSIRQTQKFKKSLQGSLPMLVRKIDYLQQQVGKLVSDYTKISLQNKLLGDVKSSHENISLIYEKYEEIKSQNFISENDEDENLNILLDYDVQYTKKLEQIKKQEKQKTKILHELVSENDELKEQVENLKKLVPNSYQTNYLRAIQAKQLESLHEQEQRLLVDIKNEKKELQAQYTANNECKQRILDRKDQQTKQIKVLEEEVLKCREQVKQVKMKYKQIIKNAQGKELLKLTF